MGSRRMGWRKRELTMSKGVGSTFKEILMKLCQIVTWIFNIKWAKIMCPVVQFLLEFLQMCIDVWEILVNVLHTLYIPVDILVSVIEFVRNTINVINSSLNECAPLPAVTFLGNNQQLSCTAQTLANLGHFPLKESLRYTRC